MMRLTAARFAPASARDAASLRAPSTLSGSVRRTPAAPSSGGIKVPFDRGKVDVFAMRDVRRDTDLAQLEAMVRPAFGNSPMPRSAAYSTAVYDPADTALSASASSPVPSGGPGSLPALPPDTLAGLKQGRYTLRCIGYDAASHPVAYGDRSFYVWTSAPTGRPPDIASLEAEKATLEATTRTGSGKTFDVVKTGSGLVAWSESGAREEYEHVWGIEA